MQRTPTRTRSQGPVDFPLDQDIDKLGKLNQRKKTPLESVPQSTPNRQDPIDPLHVHSSRSSSLSPPPAKTERGRSRRRRNPDLTQNGDTDSEEDPPYKQAPEDPQGLISTLIKALNARPTSDHTTWVQNPGHEGPGSIRRRKVLYASSYLGAEPLNDKFEQQLFTLFGDPNEVRNAEYELNNLQMKESSKASAYIAQFHTLQSRISWNDAAFTFHFRKGLPPRITDQLAIKSPKKPETSSKQEDSSKSNGNKSSKKPPQQSSGSSSTPASSSSKPRTRTTPKDIISVLSKEGFLKDDERARREKEGLCMYCGGKHDLDTCAKRLAREATKPSSKNRK
ncbi:hypothetical protein Pst134EA_033019 [Puccinia striiformis f. sp. tritici]|uniref:uncharacterized protein n=1 Tax=Puccinia striiformis f. sp. tritici TaxID=168172 RepID=UPI002008716B|nr:uncharacterized protein Pst134EA_033019 [Puccinia striiformis f. sp. tritici]KAH9443552.1 hypothetical protein Pst134EA_033019 [Puccinia striiformis f. sp. tritici]